MHLAVLIVCKKKGLTLTVNTVLLQQWLRVTLEGDPGLSVGWVLTRKGLDGSGGRSLNSLGSQ